jgi:hypothetical protein
MRAIGAVTDSSMSNPILISMECNSGTASLAAEEICQPVLGPAMRRHRPAM